MQEKHLGIDYWTRSIVLLFILGIILYSNTFNNSFHFDDIAFIVENPAIKRLNNFSAIWNFWSTRFFVFLSFALNYHIHKLSVFGYHLVNMAIHIFNSLAVFWFTHLIFFSPAIEGRGIAQNKKTIAIFVSLIFLTHPIQTQAINYVFQRTTLLAATFYLTSLCLYARAMLSGGQNRLPSKIYYSASLIAALAGMLTKETVFTLPIAVFLLDSFFFSTAKKINWRYIFPFFLILGVIPAALFLTKPFVFADVERFSALHFSRYLFTQPRVIITYIRLLLLPVGLNLDYDYPVQTTLWNPQSLGSLLAIVSIFVLGIRAFNRFRLLSFGIFWFLLTLLPESGIMPLLDVINEHRTYLASFGFIIAVTAGLFYVLDPKKNKTLKVALSVIVAIFSLLTHTRNSIWKDDLTLWSDVIHKSPKKVRPYNERGIAYNQIGEYDRAVQDFTSAISLDTNYADGYYNRGISYQNKKEYDEAISDYTQAIKINPRHLAAYTNRGVVYFLKREFGKASSDFLRVIAMEPNFGMAHNNLALAYYYEKKYDLAIKHCDRAIELGFKVSPEFLEWLKPYSRSHSSPSPE